MTEDQASQQRVLSGPNHYPLAIANAQPHIDAHRIKPRSASGGYSFGTDPGGLAAMLRVFADHVEQGRVTIHSVVSKQTMSLDDFLMDSLTIEYVAPEEEAE